VAVAIGVVTAFPSPEAVTQDPGAAPDGSAYKNGDLAPVLWCSPCRAQHKHRAERYDTEDKRAKAARARLAVFEKALDKETSPLFPNAREQYERESKMAKDAEHAASRYALPRREDLPAKMIALALLTALSILLPLFFGRLVGLHADKAGIPRELLHNWRRPYVWFASVAWVISTGCGVYTSIFASEKTWFAWDNFCIAPAAWIVLRFTELAVAFVVAAPLALLWRTGDRATIQEIRLDKYRAGVGPYVLFLQTWSITGAVVLGIAVLPWIKWLTLSEDATVPTLIYLLSGAGVVVPVLVIVGRLIRNAIYLRADYEKSKADNTMVGEGDSRHQIDPDRVADDPTKDFLGDNWWSLPATLVGGFGVIWAVLEWSGIMKVLGPR
jgi:hypothetical protein